MNIESSSPRLPLVRHAQFAGRACRLTAVAIPVLTLFSWYVGAAEVELLRNFGNAAVQQLDTMQVVLAICLSLLPTLALARSLFFIARCFDCFAGTDWFDTVQPLALVTAGRWLVISGLLIFMVPTLLGLVVTWNASAGAHSLVVLLSSNGVLSILFGLLFWSLGNLWTKANSHAAENARFV